MKNKRSDGARWAQLRDRVLATPKGAKAHGEGWLQADDRWRARWPRTVA